MAVLEWAFDDSRRHSPHRFENHSRHSAIYTATHDQEPICGWWQSADDALRARALAAMHAAGIREREPRWALIRLAFSSRADLAMIQAQDVLGLGAEARMNMPGRAAGNWHWRMAPGALTPALALSLRRATEQAGRAPARA
jgi:4-alpha-glucanotransferase